MKHCNKCDTDKILTDFCIDKNTKDGRCAQCRDCRRKHWKKYAQTQRGKEAQRRGDVKYRRKFPERIKAVNRVTHAIKVGKLIRPTTCELCGGSKKIEAHHSDYNQPLEVAWLCRECHIKVHHGD